MKKFVLCLLLCSLCCFAGCAPEKQPAFTPNPTATSSAENTVLVENITFRRGENADGEILFTSEDLEKISIGQNVVEGDSLLFTFTESGAQLLSEHTTELSQQGEKMSIWIEEDLFFCATILEPIYDGKIVLTGSLSPNEITSFYNKCYGITPVNSSTESPY